MKKIYLILLLLLPGLVLFSQEQTSYKYTDLSVETRGPDKNMPSGSPTVIARISFIEPMFVLEFSPTEYFVFSSRVRIWPTFWEKDIEGQRIYSPSLNPRITLEPRYFFTQDYRKSRGKRKYYHSGWYLGLPFTMDIPDLDYSMATMVGFQSTFGEHWYWNAGMGPGVAYRDDLFQFAWPLTAALGLVF